MKKIILLILALVMIVGLVGCGSSKEKVIISGTVTNVHENSIQIETEDKSPYIVNLTNAKYKKGVSDEFIIGNLVDIEFGGEVMESYPMQIIANRIVKNEIAKTNQ